MNSSYDLCEGDFWYTTVEAPSIGEALDIAVRNVRREHYNEPESTMWIDVRARCVDTEEEARAYVPLDPKEPPCLTDRGHEWHPQGVWGRVIENVCEHCKLLRTTNTWASDPHTGRQGLTSLHYEVSSVV